MTFSLIICTYKRPQALLTLLQSVKQQTLYPNEILIVDGSPDDFTKEMLSQHSFQNLKYYKVEEKDRGLTKQRNYGIVRVSEASEVVCFLDDDTVLAPTYFEKIIKTYTIHPEALGVGGYITNEVSWQNVGDGYVATVNEFYYDGWKRKDGSRFVWRKKLGLDSDVPPGCSPAFSHGRSVGFLPPSGKVYPVEQLMGGVSSFRKTVFDQFQFSTYFEGYGLYEDADFTLRVSKTLGKRVERVLSCRSRQKIDFFDVGVSSLLFVVSSFRCQNYFTSVTSRYVPFILFNIASDICLSVIAIALHPCL